MGAVEQWKGGKVTYQSSSVDDVGEQYADIENRLETLQIKLDRLQDLLSQAETVEDTVSYTHLYVVADIKRGDIGATATAYSEGWLGRTVVGESSFATFDADCVTLNGYMGSDAISPFLKDCEKYDKCVFALVRTSNTVSYTHLDLDAIPEEVARRAKMMVVSYPANPVCVTAPRSFYEKLVEFAQRNHIIILHDNAYSEITYDGREGISFLSIPGAKEVGVEFNSLSKTYNLTGARVSFVVGNREIIQNFSKVRSQIDYGIFLPVQLAAIEAVSYTHLGPGWPQCRPRPC